MSPEMLLRHFEKISEAPDAVARLRRLILELAIRGKLVAQDSNDMPASEALRRIRDSKQCQFGKVETSHADRSAPTGIPRGWQYVSFAHVLLTLQTGPFGSSLHQQDYEVGGTPVINPASIVDGEIVPIPKMAVGQKVLQRLASFVVREGDVIMARRGEMGRCAVVTKKEDGWLCGTGSLVLRFTDDVWPWFIVTLMSAPTSKKYLAGASVGITMQNLNQSILCGMPVGLPPTAEQRRIVVTVHELMKLCDELEAAQQKRERRRDRLVVASLHALNNSDSTTDGAQSFKESASFYFNQLPRLTIRPEHIEQLRRGIRTLAVRGKLVNQNAAEQLTRRRLGARGLRSPESPFDIPNSWAWAQVEDIGTARLGKMLDKAKNKGNLYPYLRNVNVRWFDFNLTDVFEMPFEDHELAEFQLRQGDVLICEGGEPGRAAVWDERKTGIYFQKAIHRIRLSEDVNPHFFVTVLRESADSGRLLGHFTGVGIKHLTGKGLSSLLIPLPPIEEQRRITGRVAELMANCNELETSLTRSADCRMSLLEATLHEALNSTTGDS